MKPSTKYDPIKVIEIDKAPLLEEWEYKEYFGKDTYLSKEEKAKIKRQNAKWTRETTYDKLIEQINAHIWITRNDIRNEINWWRGIKDDIKEIAGKKPAKQEKASQ